MLREISLQLRRLTRVSSIDEARLTKIENRQAAVSFPKRSPLLVCCQHVAHYHLDQFAPAFVIWKDWEYLDSVLA